MNFQNIYDNSQFFKGYSALRKDDLGFNNILEQPVIRSLAGDLMGKTVLDIGCGFGDFCRYAIAKGAVSVVGLDPSQNMIREATKETDDSRLHYHCAPVETYEAKNGQFDLIVSSLAFHYVENFSQVVQKLYRWLKPKARLIFSVEHPICTANPTARQGQDEEGPFHPVYDYRDEKSFEQTWFVEGVIKYHRTVSTYLNTLLITGFCIDQVLEPMPTDQQIKARPAFSIHKIRPPLLVITASKKYE